MTLPASLDHTPEHHRIFGFADFEFEEELLELRRNGEVLRLQQQPVKLLAALLRRAGKLVTRDELRREIWPEGVYLEYDDALNHLVKNLRDTLGDSAGRPRFIETVPRRGYRFIAPVHAIVPPANAGTPKMSEQGAPVARPGIQASRGGFLSSRFVFAAAASALIVVIAVVIWSFAAANRLPRVVNATQITHFGFASAVVTDGNRLFVQQEKGGVANVVTFPVDGSGDPTPFATPFRNARLLDISPDKTQLLVGGQNSFSDPEEIWIVSLTGGSPRRVQQYQGSSAKWSPDGSRIAFTGNGPGLPLGLYVIAADGSHPRRIAADAAFVSDWAPDGQSLRFTRLNGVTGGMSLWQVSVDGSGLVAISPGALISSARWGEGQCCGLWSRDGRYFFFREAEGQTFSLWAAPARRAARFAAAKIYASPFNIDAFSVPALSPNGHRMFVVGHNESRDLLRFDSTRAEFVPFLPGISAVFLAWSPDGQWIAYSRFPDMTLWRSRPDGSDRLQLTTAPAQVYGPAWSHDGKFIAFHSLLPGKPGKVVVISADGGFSRTLFADDLSSEDAQSWSPETSRVIFGRVRLASATDTEGSPDGSWTFDITTGQYARVPDSTNRSSLVWSPDGRQLAALEDESHSLVVYDPRTRQWTRMVSGVNLSRPYWSHDSRFIYFQDTRASEEQPIYRVAIMTGKIEPVATRADVLQSNLGRFRLLGLDPDDEPIISAVHTNADVYALDLELP